MELSIEREVTEEFLRLRVSGQWTLEDILELIDVMGAEATAAGRDRVLADLRDVVGNLSGNIAQMDRFFAGERLARVLGARIKLAVLVRADLINKFGENVAVNRGARVTVLASEPEALAWLRQ